MQFCLPQPLVAVTSTVTWLCLRKTVSFFVCLNLFLHTTTGCPLVVLFWDFFCSTSLCCLGLYKPLLYLPLTVFPNWKMLGYVFSPVWVVPYFWPARAIRKRMWKSGLSLQENTKPTGPESWHSSSKIVVNPSDKVSPSSPSQYSSPINSQGTSLFPVCRTLFPSTETEWVLKDVSHYVVFGFTVLLFKQRNPVKELQSLAWRIRKWWS